MPDDLSDWGYCGKCVKIHERDIYGFMCDDARWPLPIAVIPKPPSWLQRLFDWVRSRLRLR